MQIPIYDTGNCPRCQSPYTARLMQGTQRPAFGLLGPIAFQFDPGPYTILCEECGAKWAARPKMKFISAGERKNRVKEWKEFQGEMPKLSKKEQRELFLEYARENGLEIPAKKKKQGVIGKYLGFVLKGTVLAPIDLIKHLGGDLGLGKARESDLEEFHEEDSHKSFVRYGNQRLLEEEEEDLDDFLLYEFMDEDGIL